MGLIHDPLAEKRSLMLQQESLCNGHQTGKQCQHYWVMRQKMESANPDFLRSGEKKRMCTLSPGFPVEFISDIELPVECNRYCPSLREYDAAFEQYNPLTPEEIAEIQQQEVDSTISTPSPKEQVELLRAELNLNDAMEGALEALKEGQENGSNDNQNHQQDGEA
ncbi:hypothetical protein KAR91_22585 [Candidatus Pacearchaeota archaeon]|nr:hypothetical protein [Candidatus Pacearchaeota archaeon]